jgi:hypothetical protein
MQLMRLPQLCLHTLPGVKLRNDDQGTERTGVPIAIGRHNEDE